jgi:hypothetical protein
MFEERYTCTSAPAQDVRLVSAKVGLPHRRRVGNSRLLREAARRQPVDSFAAGDLRGFQSQEGMFGWLRGGAAAVSSSQA